ncbi:MAG: ssl1498 family light-harvesting-like protein [Limnothrix sp. RL_2_0]|nr:ssl1498 family light-harvesting-like protein [Limnothrix sp. RL_2_0]
MAFQTKDEDGKLNNFAVEPIMYKSETQSEEAQKTNMIIGLVGGFLVVALIGVTFLVSGGA